MSGSLRQVWEYFPTELWEPLAGYSVRDAAAPPDLFSDLFEAADDFLSPHPTDEEIAEARNNPDNARQRFLGLKGTDFAGESTIVHFLEQAHKIIADYEIAGFGDFYRRLLLGILSSDYPGIRHAGNPAGVRRNLATRDMTLACLLLLSFSGYLSSGIDEQVVLGA